MAIALRAVGAIVHGTTNAAPAYPAGIVAGDAVFLGVAWKLETATAPTLTGWTKVVDQAVGAGAAGAGTGAQRVVIYRKDSVAGGETGTVTVTPTGSVNVASACIIAFSKTLATWDITYDWGNDNTAAANISAPSQAQIAQTAGDLLAGFIATTANVNMGSSTFTTTGVTYGAAVEHADAGTTNGNDQRVSWVSRPITAGPQTAVTTFTSTIAGTLTGGLGFVRLREAVGGGGETTGSGAATSTAGTAAGSGTVGITGAGSATATPATSTGTGTTEATGSGAPTATPAAASGVGTATATGSGGATSPAASATGSGTASTAAAGTATTSPATATGTAAATTTGAGSATAAPGTAAGTTGAPTTTGSGQATTPDATATGAGTATTTGAGATAAPDGAASGAGLVEVGPATEPRDVAVVSIVVHPPRTVAITDASRQTVVTTAPARELAVVEHPRPVTIEES